MQRGLVALTAVLCSCSPNTSTEADVADSGADVSQPDDMRDVSGGPNNLVSNDAETPDAMVGPDLPPVQPGEYEGFGAVTRGAESSPDGFETYTVTTLADSGPGSLRDALSQSNRLIEFSIGGTITLQSDINVRWSFITIDGATAPAPGITIEQPGDIGTTIEARASTGPVSDVIIRYLRMDGLAGGQHTNAGDIWGIDGDNAPVSRVVIDHCTGTSATDGIFDLYGDVSDVTISWNMIRQTVTALHFSTGDLAQRRERVSFHHNLLAQNNERQIRIRHDNRLVDYVNNIVYGWGWMEAGAAGLHIAYDGGEPNPSLNVVNNAFLFVPGLNGDADDAIIFERGADEGSVYFAGNLVPPGEADNQSTSPALDIPAAARVTTFAANELSTRVLPIVGTHFPTSEESSLLIDVTSALTP